MSKYTCDICGAPARARETCNGDGGNHHHGMVHTILRGDTNDLARLCIGCHAKDKVEWEKRKRDREAT